MAERTQISKKELRQWIHDEIDKEAEAVGNRIPWHNLVSGEFPEGANWGLLYPDNPTLIKEVDRDPAVVDVIQKVVQRGQGLFELSESEG